MDFFLSSSPACESVLPVDSAYGGSPDSLWPHPALLPPALPAAPAALRSPRPPAAGEPVPERASSAGTRGPRLPPVMWGDHLVEGHGGPDRVPPAKGTAAALGSLSCSKISSGGDSEDLDPQSREPRTRSDQHTRPVAPGRVALKLRGRVDINPHLRGL